MEDNPIRIVIVNDQPEVCILWQKVINNQTGMRCIGIGINGEEAITMAKEEKPDIVLMDAMMPGMTGFEATEKIKQEMPEIRVIIFSAYSGTRERANACGANGYMLMPVTPDQLITTIKHVMQSP